MKLYNSLERNIVDFIPINDSEVSMYTCGPTVYDYAHIGNLRTYLFEDILRRSLEFLGYNVLHVMNITDVGHLSDDADDGEDKMLLSSRKKGMSVWDIASFYTEAFFKDCERLHIEKPHISCKATEHIDDMIALIKRIEKAGYTYEAGGNIYFDTSKMPGYGKLALLDRQNQISGVHIDIDSNKHNPRDFVLWFTKSKFENQAMQWDSPWGRGYPGWHIECSAMSMKYLGETFDIHCGGIDHLSVHHPNEIAQSEAATGKKWVNYWIHGEFLLMDQGKMSKSKGGFITLQSLIEDGYDPMDYRFLVLGAHYRSQLVFSTRSLDTARTSRQNLTAKIRSLLEEIGVNCGNELPYSQKSPDNPYIEQFKEDLRQDLNMPKALSRIWAVLKDPDLPSRERLSTAFEMDNVLGLGLKNECVAASELTPEQKTLIEKREEARSLKNWSESDRLRDELLSQGIVITDTPSGTKWTVKV
ncbi:MAG: cysteine--tRNA ligase [Spirochaetales bacterium]|nr:cysteine--tRNA ligase [Spirochaetales bacterium]